VNTLVQRFCQKAGHHLDQVKLDLSGVCSACQCKKESKAASISMEPLSAVSAGIVGQIKRFAGGHDFAARAIAMGLTLGAEVKVIQNYGHGPMLVGIQGTRIALGRGEATKILVSLR
jgi:ferrous iron transport protein A